MGGRENSPSGTTFFEGSHLNLDTVDAVDAVEEEDQDEDERDLSKERSEISFSQFADINGLLQFLYTFIPYCTFATIGLSDMKVKILRFMVNGIGMMRPTKTTISKTRSRNT